MEVPAEVPYLPPHLKHPDEPPCPPGVDPTNPGYVQWVINWRREHPWPPKEWLVAGPSTRPDQAGPSGTGGFGGNPAPKAKSPTPKPQQQETPRRSPRTAKHVGGDVDADGRPLVPMAAAKKKSKDKPEKPAESAGRARPAKQPDADSDDSVEEVPVQGPAQRTRSSPKAAKKTEEKSSKKDKEKSPKKAAKKKESDSDSSSGRSCSRSDCSSSSSSDSNEDSSDSDDSPPPRRRKGKGKDSESEEDVFEEEELPEEEMKPLREETIRGLLFKQALNDLRGPIMRSPLGMDLAPMQVTCRMEGLGPNPGKEEYAFSKGPDLQFILLCSKIPNFSKSFTHANEEDRKVKRRKFGRPWPIPMNVGMRFPPGITEETQLSVLGYKDIGIDGWAELYQAARVSYESRHNKNFGDLTIKEAMEVHIEPRLADYEKKENIRQKFETKKAEGEALKKKILSKAVRLYGKFDEEAEKGKQKGSPAKRIEPHGPEGARALKRLLDVLEGKRRDSAREADKTPAMAAAASVSAKPKKGKTAPKDKEPERTSRGAPFVVTQQVVDNVAIVKPHAGPVGLHGDVVLGGVLSLAAKKGMKVPFVVSFNRTLQELGVPRASHIAGTSVQTYYRAYDRVILTHFDPDAPAYLEMAEVGAALTPPGGPGVQLDEFSEDEDENPAEDGAAAH